MVGLLNIYNTTAINYTYDQILWFGAAGATFYLVFSQAVYTLNVANS